MRSIHVNTNKCNCIFTKHSSFILSLCTAWNINSVEIVKTCSVKKKLNSSNSSLSKAIRKNYTLLHRNSIQTWSRNKLLQSIYSQQSYWYRQVLFTFFALACFHMKPPITCDWVMCFINAQQKTFSCGIPRLHESILFGLIVVNRTEIRAFCRYIFL